MTKLGTQGQYLEVLRGEMGLSQQDFCEKIGVSRQWYSGQLKKKADVLNVQSLSELASDHIGEWLGTMAVDLLILQGNGRFVPCVCETEFWDKGNCPKHGMAPLPSASPQIPLRGYLEGEKQEGEVLAGVVSHA